MHVHGCASAVNYSKKKNMAAAFMLSSLRSSSCLFLSASYQSFSLTSSTAAKHCCLISSDISGNLLAAD